MPEGKQSEEEQSKRNLYSGVFLGLIALCLLIGYMYQEYGYSQLAKDPVLTLGYITGVEYRGHKSGYYQLNYSCSIMGKIEEHVGKYHFFVPKANIDTFLGRHFYVAFSRSDNENIQLLVTRDGFSKVRLKFPDSLKWVDRYLK